MSQLPVTTQVTFCCFLLLTDGRIYNAVSSVGKETDQTLT